MSNDHCVHGNHFPNNIITHSIIYRTYYNVIINVITWAYLLGRNNTYVIWNSLKIDVWQEF